VKRREFIAGLGGTVAWPVIARAQQPRLPMIGFLSVASRDLYVDRLRAFHQGLNDTGYTEGRNVIVEYRWANGENDRLPALALDLVRHRPDVIAAIGGNLIASAAKSATTTIPIVFSTGGDPVQAGLVASLSRPGGNLTGVANLGTEIAPKRLELLHEVVPSATSIGLLVNPTDVDTAEANVKDLQAAARTLGLQLHILLASTERDLGRAFATAAEMRVGGVVIGNDPFFSSRHEQLVTLSISHAMPAIANFVDFARTGGLMSYGASTFDRYRLAGQYVGRVLNGEKPANLPVRQGTKIELILNLKTAKALGLTIPETLLATADEVIQ
jgi:putative tryptophan/tyrosine transport system substrate-binding protein